MGSEGHTLHVLFFPFMAPGHILPMLDIAKLFAARGAKSTVLTTPANAAKLQPTIDLANNRKNPGHHHPITLHTIPFPAAAAGLPPGCEAVSSVPSGDLLPNFFAALAMLRQPFDGALRDLLPDCVVADMFFPWTTGVAAEHGVPRLVFHGENAFSLCCAAAVGRSRAAIPDSDSEPFAIPGLPHCITIHKSQIPDFRQPPFIKTLFDERRESEPKSFGVVFNSFYELEPDYADYFRNVLGRKAWHIGPVALRREHTEDESADGGAAYLHWLDGKRPGSVVYVCFGSISHTSAAEIRELALGLEASGRPFVWAIRKGGGAEWIPEGFEERVEGRGLIITEWAPQILILNHRAVGGFLTHCGWNSCLEAISAGLPLITWPLFGDQFYNERLVVDVLKVGVAVGASVCSAMPEERAVVGAERVEAAVEEVMGGGEGAEEMRRRARELGEKARRATEGGGSSYADMDKLIEELMERKIALVDKRRQPVDPDGAVVKQPLALRSTGDIVCN